MNNQELLVEENTPVGRWARHRFMALVGLTILVSLFLVSVALALYASSGAAQLDLSRPGYTSVRDQASRSTSFEGFPASGPIDKKTLDQFRLLYEEQSKKATNVDSFAGSAMTDQTLSIGAQGDDTDAN